MSQQPVYLPIVDAIVMLMFVVMEIRMVPHFWYYVHDFEYYGRNVMIYNLKPKIFELESDQNDCDTYHFSNYTAILASNWNRNEPRLSKNIDCKIVAFC